MFKCKLGELLVVKHGYAFKSENYVEKSEYGLVTLANISNSNDFKFNESKTTYYGGDFPEEFILEEDDLVMPLTEQVIGLFGNTAFIPKVKEVSHFVLNQRVGKVIPKKKKSDKYYLHYLLATEGVKNQLEYRASGTRQRNISPDDIYDVDVFIPEIESQVKIGKTLYELEKKINNNNRINAELESMAKTIYDYWFLQFDFPNENGKPYKSSGGKMIWNEELKREIPEGWRVGRLEEIADITMGSSPKGESLNEENEGTIFYQGKTDFGYRFPNIRMYTKLPIRFAEVNDILLSVRAPVGDINIADERCCIGRGLAAIRGKCQSFLFYLMLSNKFQFDKYNTGGTTFGAITKDDLLGLKIIIPDDKIMDLFNSTVSIFDKMIFNNEKASKELASLRDFLLPLLMNGQVGFK